ncbi:MAG: peptidase S10 [Acidobacteriota bacterium]
MKCKGILVSTVVLVTVTLSAAPGRTQEGAPDNGAASVSPEPRLYKTHHTVETPKGTIAYSAVVGETFVRDDKDEPEASIVTISYFQEGVEASNRPLTFLFNGGPGSTAVWLHLGAFGPRRIDFSDNPLQPGPPPYRLQPNPYTLLPYTDLVFVDPIGTGFSRALRDHEDSDFWGVDEDGAVLARFIRNFLTEQARWESPKYLAGESYGTIRAAILVRDLQLDLLDAVALNGVILISAALDTRIFMSGQPGNELNYVTNLPTYAATAYYHDKLVSQTDDLEVFLEQARTFASSEYLEALFAGDSLSADETDRIAAELARYSGLDTDYIRRANLRVSTQRYLKELLRDRSQVIGIHDTRFTGVDPDDAGETVAFDPFLTSTAGPFVAAINAYLQSDLGVEAWKPYEVFNLAIPTSWKEGANQQHAFAGPLHTTQYQTKAAAVNSGFRVFSAAGYHDLTTTFFGVEYIFDHSGIEKERITLRNYYGGHMMYLHDPSLEALSADIGTFIEQQ